jgi:hypothetical protein
MPEPLTPDDLATMEHAARRFQGAFTGTSGSLAGYVILLLRERERLVTELAVERAKRDEQAGYLGNWPAR